MFFNIFFSLVACICITSAQDYTSIRGAAWPYDNITPFTYGTPSPINLKTEFARLIIVPTPLKLTVGLFEPHTVTNTGRSVRVTVNGPVLTSVTGGVLGSNVYVFQELTYYWSGSYDAPASNSIDGDDTPLAVRIVFRNIKYPNGVVANKQRDGYAIFQVNVKVEGYSPNIAFESFAAALKSIKKAGSSVELISLPLFYWFDNLSLDNYYAYPGSRIESFGATIQQYDSATIIQIPKSLGAHISIPQFKTFLTLLNAAGNPITNTLTAYPAGCRPIVQACGFKQFFLPTSL